MFDDVELTMQVDRWLPLNKHTTTGQVRGTAAFIAQCVEIELGNEYVRRILITRPIKELDNPTSEPPPPEPPASTGWEQFYAAMGAMPA